MLTGSQRVQWLIILSFFIFNKFIWANNVNSSPERHGPYIDKLYGSIYVDPNNAGVIYHNYGGILSRSENHGDDWSIVFINTDNYQLSIGNYRSDLAVVSDNKVYYSSNKGDSWQVVYSGQQDQIQAMDIAYSDDFEMTVVSTIENKNKLQEHEVQVHKIQFVDSTYQTTQSFYHFIDDQFIGHLNIVEDVLYNPYRSSELWYSINGEAFKLDNFKTVTAYSYEELACCFSYFDPEGNPATYKAMEGIWVLSYLYNSGNVLYQDNGGIWFYDDDKGQRFSVAPAIEPGPWVDYFLGVDDVIFAKHDDGLKRSYDKGISWQIVESIVPFIEALNIIAVPSNNEIYYLSRGKLYAFDTLSMDNRLIDLDDDVLATMNKNFAIERMVKVNERQLLVQLYTDFPHQIHLLLFNIDSQLFQFVPLQSSDILFRHFWWNMATYDGKLFPLINPVFFQSSSEPIHLYFIDIYSGNVEQYTPKTIRGNHFSHIRSIYIDPLNPAVSYLQGRLEFNNYNQVFRSDDGGLHYDPLNIYGFENYRIHTLQSNKLLFTGRFSDLYHNKNHAFYILDANYNFEPVQLPVDSINVIQQSEDGRYFVIDSKGDIYQSDNQGDSWDLLAEGVGKVSSEMVYMNGRLYLSSYGQGLISIAL